MPNGGSDNCWTCWYNSHHEGETGNIGEPHPCRCLLRGREVLETTHTYCANHPYHAPEKPAFPVGPIYTVDDDMMRVPETPSPDTEEIRSGLLGLLGGLSERPAAEYPSPTRLEWEVIRQLGEFKEPRAVPGLRRVLGFAPLCRAERRQGSPTEVLIAGEIVLDRQHTVGYALGALAKILGPEAAGEIEPFVSKGVERAGLPLEVYEKLWRLRLAAVLALGLCGEAGKPGLRRAAQDPVDKIAKKARDLLPR